jgi:hypothetical protein
MSSFCKFHYYSLTIQLEIFQKVSLVAPANELYKILKMVDVVLSKYETMPYVDSVLWNGNDDRQNTLLSRAEQLFEQILRELKERDVHHDNTPLNDIKFHSDTFTDSDEGTSKQQRSNYPEWVRKILKDWYILNKDRPYPQTSAKKSLAAQTNLTVKQVSSWFVNGSLLLT